MDKIEFSPKHLAGIFTPLANDTGYIETGRQSGIRTNRQRIRQITAVYQASGYIIQLIDSR